MKPIKDKEMIPDKTDEGNFSLIKSPITQAQLLLILQKTPTKHIYKRPGKGGGQWDFVTGVYVKKVLNHVFGWLWNFEVKEHGKEGNQVWVLGRLTVSNNEGKPMIIKEQFGRADIKCKKGTEIPMDYGNDLKAASTDSLKKCASELGIASDIYGKNEFIDITPVASKKPQEATPDYKTQLMDKLSTLKKDDLESLSDAYIRITGNDIGNIETDEQDYQTLLAELYNSPLAK